MKEPGVSIIGVVPASGGRLIPITRANVWADKPRWGPDGKTIYFISNRQSPFFDVWGIHFDSGQGVPVGEEFRVTRYENPGHLIASDVNSGIALSERRLVVPITDVSGSVWVLDNIKR